jgi:hypothetical protein
MLVEHSHRIVPVGHRIVAVPEAAETNLLPLARVPGAAAPHFQSGSGVAADEVEVVVEDFQRALPPCVGVPETTIHDLGPVAPITRLALPDLTARPCAGVETLIEGCQGGDSQGICRAKAIRIHLGPGNTVIRTPHLAAGGRVGNRT